MKFYVENRADVVRHLGSNEEQGLSEAQVSSLRGEHGPNKLKEPKKKTNLERFIAQFKDVMILILMAAALISFVVATIEQNPGEYFEPFLIIAIVVLNAVIGVVQEGKAEKALDALKSLSAPHARVVRNGKESVIDASELVPGDIILLEAGDFVPADARLLSSSSLKSEESALTGESVPSEKDAEAEVKDGAPLGDRHNMVYSGCGVAYGSARAIVVATGMDTEMGKIANLLDSEEKTETPLQRKLAQLGKYLGIVALIACGVVFVVGVYNGIRVMEIFMTAVSLAVSAIPEGLPVIVTIVLSIGVQRMAAKNAIIRALPAVETLGSASVICSDKTGTLTQNKMTLVEVFVEDADQLEEVNEENSEAARKLLAYGTLCSNGSVNFDGERLVHIGDPTETSIIAAALKNGITREELDKSYPRLAELPFDSDRKLMSVIVDDQGRKLVIVKGAFDVMSKLCGENKAFQSVEQNERMSESALRVLAIGYKYIDEIPANLRPQDIEHSLTLLGVVGMIDPPRPEAKAAVELCAKAGIRPVMITGDHITTASAIAREIGIMKPGDVAITGKDLDDMTDSEFDERITDISVYARVSPENKIRIVKAWQRRDQIVSMTGDGVNDAPALKAADIGCAMGITGTDVAKGAADMTLTDDNFATIVDAVREGRGIYANIKKVVGFLLGTNIGEVITVFFAMILWHKTPLISIQLLWINLVTDSLPAIALGMEAVEGDVMDQKPKPKDEGIFAHGFGLRAILQGVMFGVLSLVAFWYGEQMTGTLEGGQTLTFMVLALTQIVQSFNMRSEHSLFKIGLFTNKKLNIAAAISTVAMLIVMFTPVGKLFELVILPTEAYLLGLGLIFVPLVMMEISKAIGLIKHSHH